MDTRNLHVVCSQHCTVISKFQVIIVAEKPELQMKGIMEELENLLSTDESINNKAAPQDDILDWRHTYQQRRDPSWIPRQIVEEVTMVSTCLLFGLFFFGSIRFHGQ